MSVMIMPSANNALSGRVIYGGGIDGAVVFNGVNTFSFATLSGSTYTLLRNIYATTCSISSGIIVACSNNVIFANVSFTNAGTLHCNGGNASGSTGGIAQSAGYFGKGQNGGDGVASGAGAAIGTGGGALTAGSWTGNRAGHGAGAWVTATTNKGGGASGTSASLIPLVQGGMYYTNNIMCALLGKTAAAVSVAAGAGGGGGAKSATGTSCSSGGGGAGGGIVAVCSPIITNTGTISSNGGNGANAAGTDASAGGGGGGAGGNVILVYDYYSNTGTVTATGGNGGTSVALGTTPLRAIAKSTDISVGTSSTTLTVTTTTVGIPQNNTLYLLSVCVSGTPEDPTISGWGLTWNKITSVDFNTVGTPTMRLLLYYAYGSPLIGDAPNGTRAITITFTNSQTTIRSILDEIFNAPGTIVQSKTATTDSATTLSVTLDGAIANSDSAVYGVIATGSTAAKTAGSGFVKISEGATVFAHSTEMSYNDTGIDFSWTGATTAGIIGIEIGLIGAMENGKAGQAGNIIQIPNKV